MHLIQVVLDSLTKTVLKTCLCKIIAKFNKRIKSTIQQNRSKITIFAANIHLFEEFMQDLLENIEWNRK